MFQTEFILSDSPPKCPFLQVVKHSQTNLTINVEIAYSPKTKDIDGIMQIVQKRYTKKDIIADLKLISPETSFPGNFSIQTNCTVQG